MSTRRTSAAPPSRSLLWPIVLGVVVLAGIVAVAVTALGGDDDTASTDGGSSSETPARAAEKVSYPDPRELDAVSVSGDPLPTMESGRDPALGEPAPVLTGVDLTGDAMTIGGEGTPTVVVFLAHWCPHCQREVPVIADWMEEHGTPADVRIAGVTTSFDETRGNWPPAEWLAEEGWTPDTMVDPTGSAAEAYGLSSFPYFVAFDADGDVVARASGELSTGEFEALISAAGTPAAA